jgi:hypothetical protein
MRALVPSLLLLAAGAWSADQIPVTSVVLYSSGVGYFEHSGAVDGVATAQLRFKTAQINDVLKSLVLQDLDGGSVGTVVFPSQDPLEKTLGSFQVDLRGNPSLAQLLGQLRGAQVQVAWQAEKVAGTILGIESRTRVLGERQTVVVPVLTVLAGDGIRQVPLDEVNGITLADPKLQAELTRALAAVASARDQDTKPVDLQFNGQGKRRVRLGYVVESPLWKVSYRLIMPTIDPTIAKDAKDRGSLQGWALVENQTDSDWNNISLSLVSGRPISFIQDLYRPLYLPRPVVEPELFAGLRPQTYEGGLEAAKKDAGQNERRAEMKARRTRGANLDGIAGGDAAVAAAAPMMMAPSAPSVAAEEQLNAVSSVQSVAQAAEVGVLFQYNVKDVTLPRQRSAMLPIVNEGITVERVSIYNQTVQAKHPLNGALVTNTTGKHLPAGPLTVFDGGAYAGDAQVGQLPPGEHRLLSYAIDIPVTVDPQAVKEESSITSGRIVEGALWTRSLRVAVQEYRAHDSAEAGRALIIEHPRRQGWTLKDTPEPIETTDTTYRFRVPVAAGKDASLTVREIQTDEERFAILDLPGENLTWYAGNGAIPPKVRTALQQAAQLKAQVAEAERLRELKQQEVQAIVQDQNRLRENMRTVNQNSDYYRRLLTKLNDQESKVETLQTDGDRLQADAEAKRQALAEFLRTLNAE